MKHPSDAWVTGKTGASVTNDRNPAQLLVYGGDVGRDWHCCEQGTKGLSRIREGASPKNPAEAGLLERSSNPMMRAS